MILLEMMFRAPLIAVDPEQPDEMHAATMEAVCHSWNKDTVTTACGLEGLKLLDRGDGNPVPWPPGVKGLKPRTRCPQCYAATGRKRPRCYAKGAL